MTRFARNSFVSAVIGISAAAILVLGVTPANAASSPPTPSESGGLVVVCPGTTANLNDSTGTPLPLATQKRMLGHLSLKCAHPNAPASGVYTQSDQASVVPLGKDTPVGHLSANLTITPGLMTWSASASSMPYGVQKTLDCEIQEGGGAWENCGSANGIGTSLTTRTNQICPVPGQSVEVDAWLDINSTQYYDAAYGTTK